MVAGISVRAPLAGTTAEAQNLLDSYGYARLRPGTIVADDPIVIPPGGHLDGCNTVLKLPDAASGFGDFLIGNTSLGGASIKVTNLITDGNRGSGASIGKANVWIEETDRVLLQNVVARNCPGANAIKLKGNGAGVRGVILQGVVAHDNAAAGVSVANGYRDVQWVGVHARDNGTDGIVCDASEQHMTSVLAQGNGRRGVWFNNLHSCNLWGVSARDNGEHGIYVVGLVYSQGGGWFASGNGTDDTGIESEVYFDNDATQSYGITQNIDVRGIRTHTMYALGGSGTLYTDYGVYVEDSITTNIVLDGVTYGDGGQVGDGRYPAGITVNGATTT